jgi:hypothetical protein
MTIGGAFGIARHHAMRLAAGRHDQKSRRPSE